MIQLCLDLKSQLTAREILLKDVGKKFVFDKFSSNMSQNGQNNLKKNRKDSILQMKIKKYKF